MIDSNSTLNGPLSLLIEKKSCLRIGKNVRIQNNVVINVSNNSLLVIDDFVVIEENTRIFARSNSRIGKKTFIAKGTSIFSREGLNGKFEIGPNCGIGDNTIIDTSASVIIGSTVAIGANCIIYTHEHEHNDLNLAAWKGKITCENVQIQSNSWVGSRVTILPGVNINEGSIIGAGSLVNKSIPKLEIWAGSPARMLKRRD